MTDSYQRIPYEDIINEAIHFGATRGIAGLSIEEACKPFPVRRASVHAYFVTESAFLLHVTRIATERLQCEMASRQKTTDHEDPIENTFCIAQTASSLYNETRFLINKYYFDCQKQAESPVLPEPLEEYANRVWTLFDEHNMKFEVEDHSFNERIRPFIRNFFINCLLGFCGGIARIEGKITFSIARVAYLSLQGALFGGKDSLIQEESDAKLKKYGHDDVASDKKKK